ncbi:8-oxo-dGTP diphosphatase MutT [Celerinatantimonas sp. YJH-8]|uniref:8-oxo-dGTP diphosphatase MutT n=1 Tax=Celerinatantimonas sp. YJH-8 TaxID=3228714 RepID=UPI0038C9D168
MNQTVDVVVGVIVKGAQILIAKRSETQHQGGLWEFPGGKVESDESQPQALVRELNEELGLEVESECCEKMFDIQHQYPDKQVILHIYWVEHFAGQAEGKEGQPIRWVDYQDLSHYEFPAANHPILQAIAMRYS